MILSTELQEKGYSNININTRINRLKHPLINPLLLSIQKRNLSNISKKYDKCKRLNSQEKDFIWNLYFNFVIKTNIL